MKWFHGLCVKYNVLNPFLVSEHLLYCFAAFLADQGLAPQTGKSCLSAVWNMQISLDLPDSWVQRVQTDIRRRGGGGA